MKKRTAGIIILVLAAGIAADRGLRAGDEQQSPGRVVERMLESSMGLLEGNLEKEEQRRKLETFSAAFGNDGAGKKAVMTFILRGVTGFDILEESVAGAEATVLAEVRTKDHAGPVRFDLVRRPEGWRIRDFRDGPPAR